MRCPLFIKFFVMPQCRYRCECHSHRTADAIFALVPDVAESATHELHTKLTLMGQGKRMGLCPVDETHQFVIGGMKLDDINLVPKTIMRYAVPADGG